MRGFNIASLPASSDPPESVVLNVDSLPIEVHNARSCPLTTVTTATGDITGLWLRGGEVDAAAMDDEMLVEAVELVERHIAPVRAVRLDAGFPSGNLLDVFEAWGCPI